MYNDLLGPCKGHNVWSCSKEPPGGLYSPHTSLLPKETEMHALGVCSALFFWANAVDLQGELKSVSFTLISLSYTAECSSEKDGNVWHHGRELPA